MKIMSFGFAITGSFQLRELIKSLGHPNFRTISLILWAIGLEKQEINASHMTSISKKSTFWGRKRILAKNLKS